MTPRHDEPVLIDTDAAAEALRTPPANSTSGPTTVS